MPFKFARRDCVKAIFSFAQNIRGRAQAAFGVRLRSSRL